MLDTNLRITVWLINDGEWLAIASTLNQILWDRPIGIGNTPLEAVEAVCRSLRTIGAPWNKVAD